MSQLGQVEGCLDDVIGPWAPKSRGNFCFFKKKLGRNPHL